MVFDTFLYNNGQKQIQNASTNVESYIVDKKKNGKQNTYYFDCKMFEQCEYVDDKICGIYKTYYENGQLRMKIHIMNNKIFGLTETYCENGMPNV